MATKKRSKAAIAKDKKYTSKQKHETAYSKKRVSTIMGYKKRKK